MSTPSAPAENAFNINLSSALPEHITLINLTLGLYFVRAVPARSAPVYEHQLQKKPTILGSNSSTITIFGQDLSLDCIVVKWADVSLGLSSYPIGVGYVNS